MIYCMIRLIQSTNKRISCANAVEQSRDTFGNCSRQFESYAVLAEHYG